MTNPINRSTVPDAHRRTTNPAQNTKDFSVIFVPRKVLDSHGVELLFTNLNFRMYRDVFVLVKHLVHLNNGCQANVTTCAR